MARELRYVRARVRVQEIAENDRGVDVGDSEERGGSGVEKCDRKFVAESGC